jgi:MFS family permease
MGGERHGVRHLSATDIGTNEIAVQPRSAVNWAAFGYLGLWSYFLYGLGTATPYLRADLGLSGFEAGLHASAVAIGVLLAGLAAEEIGARLSSGRMLELAVAAIGLGIGCVAVAPVAAMSLGGALLFGIGGGILTTQLNVQLNSAGGAVARKLMGRANALAMLTAVVSPLAIGLAASMLNQWRVALLIPIAGLVALRTIAPTDRTSRPKVRLPRTGVPMGFWFAWLFLVIAVAIEFSFVYWGSSVVGLRTGVGSADATLLASCFVAGMFTGRAAIGGGIGARIPGRVMLAGGLVVVLLGAAVVWASTAPALSGVGLFLGGLGLAGGWPIGIGLALHHAPKAQLAASARTTLGAGVAMLVAPAALGLASDGVGIVAAWPIVMALAVAGIAVLAVSPRAPAPPASTGAAPQAS